MIALVLAISTAVGFGGWGLTSLQLKQAQTANTELAIRVGKAEGQLTQLANDSDRRAKEAQAAVAAAQKRADLYFAAGRDLLKVQPSDPTNLCRSADELIRQVIEEERK